MITITRSLARQLRALFRRAGIKPLGGNGPRVQFAAGPDGLRIRSMTLDVAVEYYLAGGQPAEEFSLPLEFLDACEGRRDDPVTLEARSANNVLASWLDGSVPQTREYDAQGRVGAPKFPQLPQEFVNSEPALWQALRDALETTDRDSTRYVLGNIQLCGQQGQIAATDGRQVFVHRGFQFPWADNLLIPGLALLGCSDLAQEPDLAIGRTDQSVALRLGPWTILLTISKEGQFPRIEEVLGRAQNGTSTLLLAPTDAEFLSKALPKLPSEDSYHEPITLDFNEQVMVRAKGEGQARPTELLLSNSRLAGEPVMINIDRRFLARALKMGFGEVSTKGNNQALFCDDGRRLYIWMPLEPKDAIAASANAVRIESPPDTGRAVSTHHRMRGKTTIMSETNSKPDTNGSPSEVDTPAAEGQAASNGHAAAKSHRRRVGGRKPGSKAPGTPIEQAVALKGALRETLLQTNELIRTLKRQKKQSQLVATTLASLKQLQTAG